MTKSGNTRILSIKFFSACICMLLAYGSAPAQQVSYKDQVINVRNAVIKDGVKRAGESGILFTSEVQFTYTSEQVTGAQDSQDPHEYYFFLDIHKKDGDEVFFPSDTPDRLKKSFTKDEYVKLTADQPDWQYLRIFIPYNRIRLKEGVYELEIELAACNNSGTHYFHQLYTTPLTIRQPVMYIAKIGVEEGMITEGQYDLPGKKIPIIGLFLGSDKSKNGQGLPDAGWKVKIGGDIVFESPVTSNSFVVPAGSSSFRIAKGDPVELQFIDEDYFKSDEVLGNMDFKMAEDQGKIEKKNIRLGKIYNASVYYQQTREPELSDTRVTFTKTQYRGVTGIEIKTSYTINSLLRGDSVGLRPVFRDDRGNIRLPNHIKLVNVKLSLSKSGFMVDQENGTKEQTIFIPHYAIIGNHYAGTEFFMDGYGIKIHDAYSKTKTPPVESRVKDVTVTAGELSEVSYKGFWGVKIPLQINVPDMYYEDLDYTQLTHSIIVKNSDGYDITDSVLVVSLKEDENLRNFQLRKITKDKILFIPYARCITGNHPSDISIQYKTRYWKEGILIGDEMLKFEIKDPMLVKPDLFQLSLKYRKKNVEFYTYRILHGNQVIYQSEKLQKEKVKKVFDFSNRYFCMYDDISVEIYTIDYFNVEKKVYTYKFTPYLLSKNVFPPYDTPKGVKGFKLIRKKNKSDR